MFIVCVKFWLKTFQISRKFQLLKSMANYFVVNTIRGSIYTIQYTQNQIIIIQGKFTYRVDEDAKKWMKNRIQFFIICGWCVIALPYTTLYCPNID